MAQVQWNAGVNPFFSYEGTLTYNGEEEITFTAGRGWRSDVEQRFPTEISRF